VLAHVATATLVTLAISAAQPAPDRLDWAAIPADYQELLDFYQRGLHELAAGRLLELNRRSVRALESALRRNVKAASARDQARSRVAAMLHLDAAELLLEKARSIDAASQIATARRWADVSEDPAEPAGSFRRRWYVTAGLMLLQQGLVAGNVEAALTFFNDACERLRDDVALLTVAAWVNEQSALAPVPLGRGRSANIREVREKARLLGVADGFLKRALAVQPNDAEAGLRRGRVLILLNDRREARRVLSQVVSQPDLEDGEAYVVRLLLARVAEVSANATEALQLYDEAIAIQPEVSAARLGAARLRAEQGDAAAAGAQIDTVIGEEEQLIDPWQMYLIGHLVAATRDRSAMRAEVQQ
jgi:tetratricopeptide (TPR) repeat protein